MRYTGDYQGECTACNEYVEFALGIRPDSDPIAMHFGPGGQTAIDLDDVELNLMVDDALDVKFRYRCPLCREWSQGRASCRAANQSMN